MTECEEVLRAVDGLLYHGDFRNGVTDATGTIDEGDVRAGEVHDAVRALLARMEQERTMGASPTNAPSTEDDGGLTAPYGEAPAPPQEWLLRDCEEVLRAVMRVHKSISHDLSTAHMQRGDGASEFMREDDRDLRRDWDAIGSKARSLLARIEQERKNVRSGDERPTETRQDGTGTATGCSPVLTAPPQERRCDCPVQPTESGVNYYVEHRPECKRSAAPPQNWLRDVVQASQDEVASWPAWKRPKVPSPSKLAIRICRRINLETRVGSTKTIDWDHAVEIVEEEIGANAPAPSPPQEIVTEEIARELLQAFRDATLTIGSSVEAMRAALLAVLPKSKETMAVTEEQWIAGARVLAEQVMHYSWDGLQPGRVDKRYPAFSVGGHANAHQGDYIDAVKEIVLAVIPKLKERMGHE